MMGDLFDFWRLVKREFGDATYRVYRQSAELMRLRWKARRWCRRWRCLRARIRTSAPAGVAYCDWVACQTRRNVIYWECRNCQRRTLNPSTASEQKAWGQSCQKAPAQEAECL